MIVKEKKIYFFIACLPGIIISVMHAVYVIKYYIQYYNSVISYMCEDQIVYNPHWAINSIYELWIGNNSYNSYAEILSFILPMQIMLFLILICKTANKSNCLTIHLSFYDYIVYILIFGTIAIIPLVLNFLILLLFVPVVQPDSVYDIYYGFFSSDFLSEIYYDNPNLYILIFLTLNFIMYGLIGCISISVYNRKGKFSIITFSPEVVIIIIEITKTFWSKYIFTNVEISPLSFLLPQKSYNTNWLVIIVEVTILLLMTFLINKVGRKIETKID